MTLDLRVVVRTVAALYVMRGGPYYGLDGVEPWGIPDRDAREYDGPHPVVAHPPCKRWGRYWHGGPSAKVRRKLGDDDGCFEAAIASVRKWGGVLEHPEASHAWKRFGICAPPKSGGWIRASLWDDGWTCCVEQGHYGHRARKATWLYLVGMDSPPKLTWGPSAKSQTKLDHGFRTAEERREFHEKKKLYLRPPKGFTYEQRQARRAFLKKYGRLVGKELCCPKRMSRRERAATPEPFRDVLIDMARRC